MPPRRQSIANFTAGLAQLLGDRAIRVNVVVPGPIWTPLIPATMPASKASNFGKNTLLGRPRQSAGIAHAYVLLASDGSSYVSGDLIPVTVARPMF